MEGKAKKSQQNNEEEDHLSFMDEELQFILENFEFTPEFANDVTHLKCFS